MPALVTCAVLALAPFPVRAAEAGRTGAPAAGTGFEQRMVLRAGQHSGYACFRIPAVARAKDGTLLAFAEGRVHGCGDAGDIDIVLRRSTDGGHTWGPLKVVNPGGGDTHGNPVPVVDARTGRVLLASTYNTGRGDERGCAAPCDRTPHLQHSDDNGATWSAPRDLTGSLLPRGWNAWYATGPGHGIQLTSGSHRGRLVFGVNAESYAAGRVTNNLAALAYSDDSGDNWRIGAVDTWPVAADGTFRQKPQELSLAQLADGSIYASARETDGTDPGHRTFAVSRDGGESFAAPFRALPDLSTPQVQGSVLRLPESGRGGAGRLLLSAPADPDRRRTMMIRSSWDEGRTWDSVERGKVVTPGWSGYSDMVRISNGTAGVLYEAGTANASQEIRFARFTEGWLGPRHGPDPTTAGRAPGARPAAALGCGHDGGGSGRVTLAVDGGAPVSAPALPAP